MKIVSLSLIAFAILFFVSCSANESKEIVNDDRNLEKKDETSLYLKPWDIDCDTSNTQADMNICSMRACYVADSILQKKYQTILSELELNFAKENKNGKNIIQEKYLNSLVQEMEELKKSRSFFEQYSSSLESIVACRNDGGTISSLMQNKLLLKLTVNQIEILDEIYKD